MFLAHSKESLWIFCTYNIHAFAYCMPHQLDWLVPIHTHTHTKRMSCVLIRVCRIVHRGIRDVDTRHFRVIRFPTRAVFACRPHDEYIMFVFRALFTVLSVVSYNQLSSCKLIRNSRQSIVTVEKEKRLGEVRINVIHSKADYAVIASPSVAS